MDGTLKKRQLAFILPVAFYTLWQATAGWLSTYFAQQRLGDSYAPYNYALFFIAHAVGMALFAYLLDRPSSIGRLRFGIAVCTGIGAAITALMAVSRGPLLMVVCILAGFFAGSFAALTSLYLYVEIPAERRGTTLGIATGEGYILHYVLFTLLFPSLEPNVLQLEAVFAAFVFLTMGVLALLLPTWKRVFMRFDKSPPFSNTSGPLHGWAVPMLALMAILLLFNLSYGIQDLAATVYWMRGGAFLVHTRLFLIFGFLFGGILWDGKYRNVLLCGGFGLVALGFLAMATQYKGWISFAGLAGVQVGAAFFLLSMRMLFFDAARFSRRPVFIGALGLALPIALKQLGILSADALYKRMGGTALFITALACIALGFPFISLIFERLRDMNVLEARTSASRVLPGENEQIRDVPDTPMQKDQVRRIAYDQAVLSALVQRYGFTRRETQVLELAIHGLVNAQIAECLNIREATVKQHIRNMLAKSNMRNLKLLFLSQITSSSEGIEKPRSLSV